MADYNAWMNNPDIQRAIRREQQRGNHALANRRASLLAGQLSAQENARLRRGEEYGKNVAAQERMFNKSYGLARERFGLEEKAFRDTKAAAPLVYGLQGLTALSGFLDSRRARADAKEQKKLQERGIYMQLRQLSPVERAAWFKEDPGLQTTWVRHGQGEL